MTKSLEQLEDECRIAYKQHIPSINKYEKTFEETKKALKTLSIDVDEEIILCVEFIAGSASFGQFIVTNRQCIVSKPKLTRLEVEYYHFDKIKSVKVKKSIMKSLVQIYLDTDKEIEFTHLRCDKVVNVINKAISDYKYPKIEKTKKKEVTPLDEQDPISEIERLGSLLEKKLINEEEFELLKSKVINSL
ncbi:PH domain-containing protein [Priestia megaterium]|uniref:PH domain-containing protein n=1 Tax=Priestia megaterium TaxID=1404 RepID=UPI002E1E66D2|nr:PH domain-containing protein [Priestia megaterium]